MKRFFNILIVLVGIWALGSFVGVMFDPVRANLWTQSLMWSLLSSVILAPVFLFVGTSDSSSSSTSSQNEEPFDSEESVEVGDDPSEDEKWPYHSSEEEETEA